MPDTVLLDVRDGVAHLTLNRPDDANSINQEMADDLLAAATTIAGDRSVRAVLLSGAGARFCGGGDVRGFNVAGDIARGIRLLVPVLHAAIAMLVRGDAPVVAAVHGAAAGAGMGFVGMSDLVVAAESTKFVMAYTQIGLAPDGSSSWFLPRLVGLKRALELTLTNRVLTASEALDYGLVTRVVPDPDVHDEAAALAAQLAAGPTVAYGIAKRLIHTSLEDTFETHLAREGEGIASASTTRDAHEGIRAFAQKRPPAFTGE